MFAPLVAKPKAKPAAAANSASSSRRAGSFGHRENGGGTQYLRMLRRTAGSISGNEASRNGGDAGNPLEREADRAADAVMSMPAAGMAPLSALPQADPATGDAHGSVHQALLSPGQPMDASARAYFEPRFGRDFSRVRVHSDGLAEQSARAVNAQAYTVGHHIVFGAGGFAPRTHDGRRLFAHELAHVVQQSASGAASAGHGKNRLGLSLLPGPRLQRKLLVTGNPEPKRIQALFNLLEPGSGLTLAYDRKTEEVSISAAVAKPSSPALAVGLEEIIDDPRGDSVLSLGGPQQGVSFGMFPTSGPLTQVIDIDDLARLDAGAPGSGVATLFHEIVENYHAHVFGRDFEESHAAGLEAEGAVAGELVGPGERVAETVVDKGKGVIRRVRDYEQYFLVYDRREPEHIVLNAWQAARVNVGTFTIDGFGRGSDAVPATAQAEIEAVANAMRMNPLATVRIDCGGPDPHLALRRAERIQGAVLDNGKSRNLYGFDFRSELNFNLVATGAADERAVITVDQPDTEVQALRGSLVKRALGGTVRPSPPQAGLPDWRPRR